jgi:hypothetical protein
LPRSEFSRSAHSKTDLPDSEVSLSPLSSFIRDSISISIPRLTSVSREEKSPEGGDAGTSGIGIIIGAIVGSLTLLGGVCLLVYFLRRQAVAPAATISEYSGSDSSEQGTTVGTLTHLSTACLRDTSMIIDGYATSEEFDGAQPFDSLCEPMGLDQSLA